MAPATIVDPLALEHWRRHDDPQGICWLTLDKKDASANTLSRPVIEELATLIDQLERRPVRGVVLRSGKENGFILGADINEFTGLASEPEAYTLTREAQKLFDRLEALPFPVVAMINGAALGGGLELAMACDYRVCVDADRGLLGLPEVKLGIHPGFGGTVRSVRLVGAPSALDMMLTGRQLRPARAKRLGLVDRLAPAEELEEAAMAMIHRRPPPARAPWHLRLLTLPGARAAVAARVEKEVRSRARSEHYPAPYAIVDLFRQHGAHGDAAYDAEARSIARLFMTPASKNLVRVFFLQEKLKSLAKTETRPVRRVHVVGAGVMGGDIAAWCALRGLEVTLQDRAEDYVDRALARARKLFERRLRKPDAVEETAGRLRADVAGEGVPEADLVLEAIFEDLEAKRALYAELEPRMKADALLATNTSSIRLELLAGGLATPGRLIGLHFFNPVAQLPLVEVVRGDASDGEAVDAGLAFVGRIGKLPLPCASSPGFLVNRILAPYMAEAMHLHREGVRLEVIDEAALAFGMPMGPVELADTVGLDVAHHVAEILGEAFGKEVPRELGAKVEAGELGRKSGRGFYAWKDGKAIKQDVDPEAASGDLQDRLILPMVNEAVACWRESVVGDLDSLDAGVIFGTGFAPFRGGPMQYARERGIAAMRQRLEELAGRYGERFSPDQGWEQLERGG
jgi:3-hydroxyacyl-CoA dehydrogenase/enoyl-CoA hydratase/3-hydroxybutyryl-CoA epimerase